MDEMRTLVHSSSRRGRCLVMLYDVKNKLRRQREKSKKTKERGNEGSCEYIHLEKITNDSRFIFKKETICFMLENAIIVDIMIKFSLIFFKILNFELTLQHNLASIDQII